MKQEKMRFRILWTVIFALLLSTQSHAAPRAVKGRGVLTAIEDRKNVIIDERGYEVSPSAEILNEEKKQVPLDRLSPPVKVYFEYVSTQDGAVITLLAAIPRKPPK